MIELFEKLAEKTNFTETFALEVVTKLSCQDITHLNPHVAAYLCGYKIKELRNKTDQEIEAVINERIKKHKKELKFANKKNSSVQKEIDKTTLKHNEELLITETDVDTCTKEYNAAINLLEEQKLELPVLDESPVDSVFCKFHKKNISVDMRSEKDDFYPELKGFLKFHKMVKELQEYQVLNVTLRGNNENKKEKDERSMSLLMKGVYKHQGHVARAWDEILTDYQLGCNNVIFNETLKNYATFIAYLTEYRKLVNAKLKAEPRLIDIYKDIFKDFDPKADWFAFALEEALTLCAGANSEHSGVPAELIETKKMFWNQVKSSTVEIKEFFKQ